MVDANGNEAGGLGGKVRSERGESGLTEIHEARMLSTAVKRGWLPGQRWPVDATTEDFEKTHDERPLTMRELTAYGACKDVMHPDPRIRARTRQTVLAMEAQNMEQEKRDNPQSEHVEHRHIVHVVEDENWYRNDAHTKAAEAFVAPAPGPIGQSSIQGGGLRAPLGQNGNGSTNGHSRPRPDEGHV